MLNVPLALPTTPRNNLGKVVKLIATLSKLKTKKKVKRMLKKEQQKKLNVNLVKWMM